MLDTAIVGGGVCGLALAASLAAQQRPFALFEARPRLGGRVYSEPSAKADMRVDLGPTWYWPDTQPGMARLVGDLGLVSFPQHDEGAVLRLHDYDKKAEAHAGESVHGGARRVQGGMLSVIEALAQKIPADGISLDYVLEAVIDRGDHVELHFKHAGAPVVIAARRVVLAMPPRIVEERVRFTPDLDPQLVEAMCEIYTWMAGEAKAVICYDKPLWREEGRSGNAFVTHEQAVLGEIFDACDATGTRAALGGFLALAPGLRDSFKNGLPMLMGNQMGQVFGPALEHGEQHYKDWATEDFTCSRRDLIPPDEHPHYGNPFLRQPLWEGRLFLGGSETASYAGGYMEGALDAARRLARDIALYAPAVVASSAAAPAAAVSNAASVAAFSQWVGARQAEVLDLYKRHLNKLLASPDKEIVTQRAMVMTVEQVFSGALLKLDELEFDMRQVPVENGRSALTPELLNSFNEFLKVLIDSVVESNRTSCALSNFPGEDKLSKDYMQAIMRDIAAAWKEFCLSVNALLLAKSPAMAAE